MRPVRTLFLAFCTLLLAAGCVAPIEPYRYPFPETDSAARRSETPSTPVPETRASDAHVSPQTTTLGAYTTVPQMPIMPFEVYPTEPVTPAVVNPVEPVQSYQPPESIIYQVIGNITIGSDGTTWQDDGNFRIHSNGSISHKHGDILINPDGTTTQQIGNTLFHSDGTVDFIFGDTAVDSD